LNNILVQFFQLVHQSVVLIFPDKNISYGVAIILMTLIIRLVVLPLNIKQTKSSMAMSELQPETKKLQEKYKNDPQKAQQEIMKLYKERGASPLSGCLPMLIQWPILIALYYVFNNLHGINGVQFLGIRDLSENHNIILALLSGITTFYSGTLMMPSGGGAQAKQTATMNISMSIFMTCFSWNMKAALVLYWITNNTIQIIQTLIMKKVGIYKTVKNA
jgi:YidC/Oxa1 family membrane protein insertase